LLGRLVLFFYLDGKFITVSFTTSPNPSSQPLEPALWALVVTSLLSCLGIWCMAYILYYLVFGKLDPLVGVVYEVVKAIKEQFLPPLLKLLAQLGA
jgi:hypothetical protein